MAKRSILIFGASYGALLAAKLALAGHDVKLVCRARNAELINAEGIVVRMPVKGREGLVEVRSRELPGRVTACTPEDACPAAHEEVRRPGRRRIRRQPARSADRPRGPPACCWRRSRS